MSRFDGMWDTIAKILICVIVGLIIIWTVQDSKKTKELIKLQEKVEEYELLIEELQSENKSMEEELKYFYSR